MDPSAVTWARSDSFPGSVKLPAAPTAPAPLPLPYQAERVPRALPTNVSSSVPSLYSQIPPSSSFGVATGPTQILTDKGALDDQLRVTLLHGPDMWKQTVKVRNVYVKAVQVTVKSRPRTASSTN